MDGQQQDTKILYSFGPVNGNVIKQEINTAPAAPESGSQPSTGSPIHLREEKGVKIDVIRVLNALYELGKFTGEGGSRITKKDFFTAMGRALNIDLSNYDKDLSRSTSDSTALDKHLRIFDDMRQKMTDIFNSK